ncbi:aliphatic sulfonate ABC transporter substrate-binding protein [Burkholderia sp. WAC0059]|uniref:aliphatic sulfonate ABC transporter substrate-binding protein n=1 Tax=Burkholderia sp. WAC0059 TaxID=2066022 RepID=UPI000C7EE811|nr:aliphatic sulfonate ABC transporter substrate-binding protein [Burkholderia sp. WAC0059]PLZ03801.1 aliphatic sulfonate ABC transporter substrate-binding protein [Burkholderia sp. WAC0059]
MTSTSRIPTRLLRRRAGAAAVALALASGIAHAQQPAPDHTVRIGYQKAGLLAVLKAQGSLERALVPLGYSVKWFEFPAGPQLLEALNANSVDFGYTGAPPPVFAQAAGIRFVYVGAEPGGLHNEALFVRPDSPIRTLADLRGKRVALQKGSSSNYLLLQLLAKGGLSYGDIRPIYLAPADARAAFENGDVDAWVVWDPYYAAAQQALHARTIADYTPVGAADNFYEATRDFAQQQPAVVGTILAQLRKTGLWVDAHPAETATLLAPQVGLDRSIVETWVRRVPYGEIPVGDDVVSAQQKVADAFYGARLIPQKIAVRDVVWQAPASANAAAK